MSNELNRLECRICGRFIYFPIAEAEDGECLIELTWSHGHTDSYWNTDRDSMNEIGVHAEMSRAVGVGL